VIEDIDGVTVYLLSSKRSMGGRVDEEMVGIV
jgi:hypothetical protein